MAIPLFDPQIEQRLRTENNIWLATVRPNGAPHLVPIWFVWCAQRIYVCTEAGSVKARNLLHNPQVSIALEDGNRPIVFEGVARFAPAGSASSAVAAEFRRKYDWDVTTDREYNRVIEIEPTRIRM